MADDAHFTKPAKRKSVMERNSTYRDNCSAGFTSGDWQAHHIACHHSVGTKVIEPQYTQYVNNCIWITEWDLNASANLIGLPINKQYRATNGTFPVNYCSHQVDHNTKQGYTDECTQWLQKNLWDTLKSENQKHEVTAKQIQAELENCTTTFKAHLTERGSRKGGTLHCWTNRFPNKPQYVEEWYYPFSMADLPNERHPGVDSSKLELLRSVFKLIS